MSEGRVTFGPFTGGINRAVAQDKLAPTDLWEACGVYQDERGSLAGCFETALGTLDVTFVNSAETNSSYYDNRTTPLRVFYWSDAGTVWQLYGQNASGTTSIRCEGIDRSYGSYDASAVNYRGFLILCGSGETASAYSSGFYANASVSGTSFSYNSGSGIVSTVTFSGSGSIYHILAGDVFVVSGSRYSITSVTYASTFSISTGSTFTTGNFYIERARPVYLAESYTQSAGGATVSYGSRTVTLSTTAGSGLAVNGWLTFSENATGWNMANLHPRSYQVSTYSGVGPYTVTLTDAYEGAAGTNVVSTRLHGTALQIALPFVYQDRLCAVGASPTNNDYNVIYWSGYPGQASPSVIVDDVFDWHNWDTVSATYPIGLNAGAIQRCEPSTDRVAVFCQNAVYEWRGTLPVDAALGSNMSDRPIAQGIGASTYDSVVTGPDGQTIYFASPDGLYKLYGFTVEPIDAKIRAHELYTTNLQMAAYWDNRVYFSQVEDDPDRVAYGSGTSRPEGYRKQYNVIWIYDLLNGSFTYTQRLWINEANLEAYLFVAPHPTYNVLLPGGVFNPYRGDLTQREVLFVSRPGGLVLMNDPQLERASRAYHCQAVITGTTNNNDVSPKRVRRTMVDVSSVRSAYNTGSLYVSVACPIEENAGDDPTQTKALGSYALSAETRRIGKTRHVLNGASFPYPQPRIGAAVGEFAAVERLDLGVTTTSTFRQLTASSAQRLLWKFTAPSLAGVASDFNEISRFEIIYKADAQPTATTPIIGTIYSDSGSAPNASVGTFGILAGSFSSPPQMTTGSWVAMYGVSGSTDIPRFTSGSDYWMLFGAGDTCSIGIVDYTGSNIYTCTNSLQPTLLYTDKAPAIRAIHSIGYPIPQTGIDAITVDYQALQGRNR